MEHIQLWLADIRTLPDCEQRALPLLTPERRKEAERTKPEQDRLHCIAAGLLLRYVLGVASDEDVKKDPFGKSHLTGEGPCFNLSHGGNYAVLAVSGRAVGVDVEPIGEKIPGTVSRRFLQPDELEWLEENKNPEGFAWLWTRLESALKADGRGFAMENREFSVLNSGEPWHLETLNYDGHCISCAAEEPFESELKVLSIENLIR